MTIPWGYMGHVLITEWCIFAASPSAALLLKLLLPSPDNEAGRISWIVAGPWLASDANVLVPGGAEGAIPCPMAVLRLESGSCPPRMRPRIPGTGGSPCRKSRGSRRSSVSEAQDGVGGQLRQTGIRTRSNRSEEQEASRVIAFVTPFSLDCSVPVAPSIVSSISHVGQACHYQWVRGL